ncbi:MAG: CapA family protein [Patescibacteria group bacterium]
MFPTRSIAFMNLYLSCVFSIGAVLGAIVLPSYFSIEQDGRSLSLGNMGNVNTQTQDAQFAQGVTTDRSSVTIARLLFVGDIMLARGVEWRIGKTSLTYPLSDITDYLSAPDLTIGNFEGTIRDTPNQELDGFTFDTTPAIAQTIADAGIDFVSLSNNHSDNYGSTVVASTRSTIASLGMTPFGDPYVSKDFIGHATINGIAISFIGFHAFGEEPESIVDSIKAEKAAGNFVIIFPHWGNEYQNTPSAAQTDAAHLFIDSGADAIIGAHPHVIQTYENYKGAPIIYSLGNFLFDQSWSVPTSQGLTLGFDIDAESITMSFAPISITKEHVTLMNTDDAAKILSEHNLPLVLKISRPVVQNTAEQQ